MVGAGQPQIRQSIHRAEPHAAAVAPAQRSMDWNWARQAIVAKIKNSDRTSGTKPWQKSAIIDKTASRHRRWHGNFLGLRIRYRFGPDIHWHFCSLPFWSSSGS